MSKFIDILLKLIVLQCILFCSCKDKSKKRSSSQPDDKYVFWSSLPDQHTHTNRALALHQESGTFIYWKSTDISSVNDNSYQILGNYSWTEGYSKLKLTCDFGEIVLNKKILETGVTLTIIGMNKDESHKRGWILKKSVVGSIKDPFAY